MDERIAASQRHFDRWSTTYEHDRASRRLLELQTRALQALALAPDDELLDVACGTGAAVRAAARTVRRAVGLDLSSGMVAQAKARADAAAPGNVEFIEGSATQMPFPDGAFTALLCTTAFHHFTEPTAAIGEMARVLAPGGRLVIGDANCAHPAVFVLDRVLRVVQRSHVGFRSPGRLQADLRAAGLRAARAETLWHGGYVLVRGDA